MSDDDNSNKAKLLMQFRRFYLRAGFQGRVWGVEFDQILIFPSEKSYSTSDVHLGVWMAARG
jgi:hypothetical protein